MTPKQLNAAKLAAAAGLLGAGAAGLLNSKPITPYSPRAREGAPVAWPVTWEQLPQTSSASAVTIATASERIKEPDPWPDYTKTRQGLTAAILRNLGISPD